MGYTFPITNQGDIFHVKPKLGLINVGEAMF